MITLEPLSHMEQSNGWQRIASEEELRAMRRMPACIVYLLVTWSGPERVSRSAVYHALQELKVKLPVFLIDCSEMDKLFVEEWLQEHKELPAYLYAQGWGETLYCQQGRIVDIIKNPGKMGREATKVQLAIWNDSNNKKRMNHNDK